MKRIIGALKLTERFNRFRDWTVKKYNIGEKDFLLILYIAVIILVNLVSATLYFRFDFTRGGTYSLSQRSREVVSNLKEKLNIRLLFSRDLPPQHTIVFRYLKDMLEEYSNYSNRNFSYTIVSEDNLKKEADDFGIHPVQSQELSSDRINVRNAYMAMVIQHADLIEKLDRITEPNGLEFLITGSIEKLTGKIDGLLSLNTPIAVRLYLDRRLKQLPIDGIKTLEAKVKTAVDKCSLRNYGKLKFELVDTSDPAIAADIPNLYGLSKLKWQAGATPAGERFDAGEGMLGIVLESSGKFAVVELAVGRQLFGNYMISGIEDIEERLNESVGSLVSASPKIGYVIGHGELDVNDEQTRMGAGLYRKVLSDLYELRAVDLSKDEIPGDFRAIVINGPKSEFSEFELYRIDQFLMKGKSAVFFLDSFIEKQEQQQFMYGRQPAVLPVVTGLEKLLGHYGVTVGKNIVLDRRCANLNLGQIAKDIPLIPLIDRQGLDRGSVITKYLSGIAFIKASTVDADEEKIKKAGLVKRDLVRSSGESWLMQGNITFNPYILDINAPKEEKDYKSFPLAVLLSGTLESYFRGRDIPVNPAEGDKKAVAAIRSAGKLDATVKAGKSEIIVVGSSEITTTAFMMNAQRLLSRGSRSDADGAFSNGLFLHGIADYMAGNYHVPEMKSKSIEFNPLNRISDGARFAMKAVNIAGIPFMVVIAGLVVLRLRVARKRKIMDEFNPEATHE